MISRLQYELSRFERDFLHSRSSIREIAISPRKFDAMADVESMMWLQLGLELGIFDTRNAAQVFENNKSKLLASLNYVTSRKKISTLFRGEVDILSTQVRTQDFPLSEHPRRLSGSLFANSSVEMLFHEVGRGFRDGVLTICFVFASSEEFHKYLKGKPDPIALLRGDNLRGVDLLLSEFLRFLGHAGALQQLWEYFGSMKEHGNYYALSALRERVQAMHSWRLTPQALYVRDRLNEITDILVEGVEGDAQLRGLGFEAAALLPRIEALYSSWNGDDNLLLDGTVTDGEGEQGKGEKGRAA